jgi:uncharacterized protein with HEPN domain
VTFVMPPDRVEDRLRTILARIELPEELLSQAPDIPWAQVAGMRNVLAHDYEGVIDTEMVWDVATRRLSELESAVRRLLDLWAGTGKE